VYVSVLFSTAFSIVNGSSSSFKSSKVCLSSSVKISLLKALFTVLLREFSVSLLFPSFQKLFKASLKALSKICDNSSAFSGLLSK
jgi:hypothetical protein